jgi:hypothetical protein
VARHGDVGQAFAYRKRDPAYIGSARATLRNRGRTRRVGKVVGYPPLSEMSAEQRREFHEALLEAYNFRGSTRELAGGDPEVRAEPAEAARRQQRLARRARRLQTKWKRAVGSLPESRHARQ